MEFIIGVLQDIVTVVLVLLPFAIPQVREFVIRRFQHSLDKALEDRKTLNDRKNYISKVKFDKEFEMYQELSKKNITMVYSIGETVLVTRGSLTEDDDIEKHKKKVCDAINAAELTTKQYAPFIDESLFNKYHQLQKQASSIFTLFKFWCRNDNSNFITGGITYNRETAYKAIEEKQKILSSLSDEIIREVRDYLNSLSILEGKK